MTPQPLTMKARLLLATFGIAFGLIILAIALQFIPAGPKGTEFNSISDVRKAMLQDGVPEDSSSPETGNVSLRGIVMPHPNDQIIYTLRPNLDLRFVRAQVRTNACGMRDTERSIPKKPGTFRIALLGDSFAFGWGVEQNETFAYRLEQNLNRLSDGRRKFEVLNFGVPGYSTFQEVALYDDLASQFSPDAVLVYFVQNDFGMPFFIRDIDGSGGILSSIKFVQLGKRLFEPQEMDQKIQQMGLDPNHALQRLAKLADRDGVPVYLAINPRKEWNKDRQALWALKNNLGIRVMDLRTPIMETINARHIKEEDLTLSFDPHPSPIRHAILGDILTTWFLQYAGPSKQS